MRLKDNMLIGMVIGLVIPPAIVWALLTFTDPDLVEYSASYLENVCLLAIGLNAGVMLLVLNRLKLDLTGRGILLANFAYVIAFIAYFYAT